MTTLETEVVESFQSLGVTPEVAMRAAAALYRREGDRLRETEASIAGIKGDSAGCGGVEDGFDAVEMDGRLCADYACDVAGEVTD